MRYLIIWLFILSNSNAGNVKWMLGGEFLKKETTTQLARAQSSQFPQLQEPEINDSRPLITQSPVSFVSISPSAQSNLHATKDDKCSDCLTLLAAFIQPPLIQRARKKEQ